MLTCAITMKLYTPWGSTGPVLPLFEATVGATLTLESCGAACYKSNPNNGIGGVVGGNQCFCGSSADLSSTAAKARSLASRAQCETKPCVGDPTRESACGGDGTMLAYAFTCDDDTAEAGTADVNRQHQQHQQHQQHRQWDDGSNSSSLGGTTLIDTDKTCFSCFRIPTLLAGLTPGVVHAFAEGRRSIDWTYDRCSDGPDTHCRSACVSFFLPLLLPDNSAAVVRVALIVRTSIHSSIQPSDQFSGVQKEH